MLWDVLKLPLSYLYLCYHRYYKLQKCFQFLFFYFLFFVLGDFKRAKAHARHLLGLKILRRSCSRTLLERREITKLGSLGLELIQLRNFARQVLLDSSRLEELEFVWCEHSQTSKTFVNETWTLSKEKGGLGQRTRFEGLLPLHFVFISFLFLSSFMTRRRERSNRHG